MRILVTGGAGYIGSITARHLLDQGHDVVVLDSLVRGHAAAVPEQATLVEADISDRPAVDAALEGCDAVVHCAGYIEVAESMAKPELYLRNNVTAPQTLLEACVAAGADEPVPVVFSSTAAVYGNPAAVPIPEDAQTRPISPYGESKLQFELLLAAYQAKHRLRHVILRYFNAAGAWPDGSMGESHDPETHLVPRVLAALSAGQPVTLNGTDWETADGTCVRDYVHVVDIARAHLAAIGWLARDGFPVTANLGTGRGYSVRQVVTACEAATGLEALRRHGPRRIGDPPQLVAGVMLAQTTIGWMADDSDLTTIVEDAWRWHQAHPTGYGS